RGVASRRPRAPVRTDRSARRRALFVQPVEPDGRRGLRSEPARLAGRRGIRDQREHPAYSSHGNRGLDEVQPHQALNLGIILVVRPRRWLFTALAVLVAGLVLVAGRGPLLRSAGRFLVVDEPVRPADFIVIAIDAGGSGVLEAADLVHSGISPRVALFA